MNVDKEERSWPMLESVMIGPRGHFINRGYEQYCSLLDFSLDQALTTLLLPKELDKRVETLRILFLSACGQENDLEADYLYQCLVIAFDDLLFVPLVTYKKLGDDKEEKPYLIFPDSRSQVDSLVQQAIRARADEAMRLWATLPQCWYRFSCGSGGSASKMIRFIPPGSDPNGIETSFPLLRERLFFSVVKGWADITDQNFSDRCFQWIRDRRCDLGEELGDSWKQWITRFKGINFSSQRLSRAYYSSVGLERGFQKPCFLGGEKEFLNFLLQGWIRKIGGQIGAEALKLGDQLFSNGLSPRGCSMAQEVVGQIVRAELLCKDLIKQAKGDYDTDKTLKIDDFAGSDFSFGPTPSGLIGVILKIDIRCKSSDQHFSEEVWDRNSNQPYLRLLKYCEKQCEARKCSVKIERALIQK